MYYPNKKEFIKLSKKGNLIPVYHKILADTETPVSAYNKISSKYSFLLESVEGGEEVARYSFLAADPILVVKTKEDKITVEKQGRIKEYKENPLVFIKKLIQKYKPVKVAGLPRFHGGLIGYLGYDIIRFIEKIPNTNKDELKLPDIQLMLTDTILAFDHVKHTIIIISNAHVEGNPTKAYNEAIAKINKIAKKIKATKNLKELETARVKKESLPSINAKEKYNLIQRIKNAKNYIKNGDIIQVVLSERFKTKTNLPPFNIYRQLRIINPSPYMYYLSFGNLKLIGSSPEVMVRLENGTATLRPIAGTRPRGQNEEEDKKLEKDLLASVKEKAEHLMLVDLGRNDLGRVCQSDSIKVNDYMNIEKYSHVMHIVSQVNGKIKKNKDAFDLFSASFPAGTVSGAPKIRAMQIIDELEQVARGPYSGAVGYFSFSGDLDACINIRTIVMKDKNAYIQAGAGIVSDSNPEKEVNEIRNKAKAMFKAISMTKE